ncbi:MAG: PLP-dependent aspartate aminotransferase family protein [Bacillota bacterium]
MNEHRHHFDTRAIHSGEEERSEYGAHVLPIYQTSTFVFDDVDQGARRFRGEEPGYIYSRLANPTVRALEKKMADLENGEDALAFASGMGAISAALMQHLSAGDHVVSIRTIYGSTYTFMTGLLKRFGVEVSFADGSDLESIRKKIRPNTRLLYGETPANPVMSVLDLEGFASLGEEFGIPTIVDNTFMSPALQRPLEFGVDVVVHSATKYLGGHGDVVGGIVVGSSELIARMRDDTLRDIGAVLGPFDAWLLVRGLKTLPLRVARHSQNAAAVSDFLQSHSAVDVVHYPGLPSHPGHRTAAAQNPNGFGGMMSFELTGGIRAGRELLNSVRLCTLAVSLGAPDTLIQHPASMTHSNLDERELLSAGINPGLIRLSVGLEDASDIIADLESSMRGL